MNELSLEFWGVRGSLPAGGKDKTLFGTDTCCIEVKAGGHHIILDAGSGLRRLGAQLAGQPNLHISFFLSHAHWDHVCGLPFFTPFYQSDARIDIYMAGQGQAEYTIEHVFSPPLCPVTRRNIKADLRFIELPESGDMDLGNGFHIRTEPLNHPGGATGFRLEGYGKVISYLTDFEHTPGVFDPNVLKLMHNADLAIYDSSYTDSELKSHIGWGHSTVEEAIRLAKIAKPAQLALFHHIPERSDSALLEIESAAQKEFSGVFAAREGQKIDF